jgi:hypothetical protein
LFLSSPCIFAHGKTHIVKKPNPTIANPTICPAGKISGCDVQAKMNIPLEKEIYLFHVRK